MTVVMKKKEDYDPEETLAVIEGNINAGAEPDWHYIAPYVSKELMKLNKKNRPLSMALATKYGDFMLENRWKPTGEPLIFSKSGKMLNGQHRCQGSIIANAGFLTLCVYGIDDDAFVAMDRGKVRSPANTLALLEKPHAETLYSAIRWATKIRDDDIYNRAGLETDETIRLLKEEFDEEQLQFCITEAIWQKSNVTNQPAGIVAAIMYLYSQKHPVFTEKVIKAFRNSTFDTKYPVFKFAFNELKRIEKVSFGRVNDSVRAVILGKAWKHASHPGGKKSSPSTVKYTEGEKFPKI